MSHNVSCMAQPIPANFEVINYMPHRCASNQPESNPTAPSSPVPYFHVSNNSCIQTKGVMRSH